MSPNTTPTEPSARPQKRPPCVAVPCPMPEPSTKVEASPEGETGVSVALEGPAGCSAMHEKGPKARRGPLASAGLIRPFPRGFNHRPGGAAARPIGTAGPEPYLLRLMSDSQRFPVAAH